MNSQAAKALSKGRESLEQLRWVLLNTLQAIFLFWWTALWVAITFCILPFDRERAIATARRYWADGLLWAAGCELDAEGFDELPDEPVIFLFNHQSMLDIPVCFAATGRNFRFIAKKEVAYIPLIGWFVWAMGMIFIDRKNLDRAKESLEQAGQVVREGACVLGYPEGGRSRDGRIKPLKKGLFMLALNAQVPVVPVALEGTLDVLPSDGFRIRPGKVRVKAGTPIQTAGMTLDDRDVLMEQVHHALIDLHLDVGGCGGPRSPSVAPSREKRSKKAKKAA